MGILPMLPLELICRQLADNAAAARPSLAARLGDHAGATFAIDPVDCPFAFLVTLWRGRPIITLRRDLAGVSCAARIAAPLVVLVGMLDGSYDGDALFFSRDLVIEGDTAAVLALRNALDDAELDLVAEAAATLGPFAPPAERIGRLAAAAAEELTGVALTKPRSRG